MPAKAGIQSRSRTLRRSGFRLAPELNKNMTLSPPQFLLVLERRTKITSDANPGMGAMNAQYDYELEPVGLDELIESLRPEVGMLGLMIENDKPRIFKHNIDLKLLDIKYPYVCYRVDGQENACKLTAPADLPADIRGIYLVDYGLNNLYATNAALLMGVQACVYSHFGKSGTATVSGMSAMRFNTTRPDNPTSPHNTGRAFDVKLQGRMKSDGTRYDKLACAYLCLYCVEAGATRVYFSDHEVVKAVNETTGKTVCEFLGGHENHVHLHKYN